MSVTITDIQWTGLDTVVVTWTSTETDPTFRVYVDGALYLTTETESATLTVPSADAFDLDILDSDADPAPEYPARWTLGWWRVVAADHYRIEEYVAGAWTVRARINEDGDGYYQWLTRRLEDETEHQFRVIAVGTDGNESTPLALTALMVRRPDEPDVDYTYDADTGVVTIAAA